MIEAYLTERPNLVGLVLLMDIRREWTEEEELLAQFLRDRQLPYCVVATKADKLSRSEIEKAMRALAQATGHESLFAISNLNQSGASAVEKFIYSTWVKPFRGKKWTL